MLLWLLSGFLFVKLKYKKKLENDIKLNKGVWAPLPIDKPKKVKKNKKIKDKVKFVGKYTDYLQSKWWFKRRKRALKLSNFQCQECKSKYNLQVHHLRYDNLGFELDKDLQVLCASCHHNKHRAIIEMNEHFNSI